MKDLTSYAFIALVIILTATLVISTLSLFGIDILFGSKSDGNHDQSTARVSSMSLTSFDKEMAKQFMDKNNDGKCDACGMPVELCMESGQMQCNMDPSSTMGVLGTAHIHADWKVYIDGKAADFSDKAHEERMQAGKPVSSFIHVDSGSPLPEKTGDVLHMHATGIPLWLFFKSIDGDFNETCIKINGEQHCINNEKTLKFYVNSQPNSEYGNYIFKDHDRILISYGDEKDLSAQLSTITDFSKKH